MSERIELTRGLFATIDSADFAELSQFRWHANVQSNRGLTYAVRFVRRGVYEYMHRRILPDAELVDHRNHDGLDNRRINLRPVTHAQNMRNRKKGSNNRSGFIGVHWDAGKQRWRARIRADGREIHVGWFTDPSDAALSRDAVARELHGEFASLNFP